MSGKVLEHGVQVFTRDKVRGQFWLLVLLLKPCHTMSPWTLLCAMRGSLDACLDLLTSINRNCYSIEIISRQTCASKFVAK